MSGVTCRTCQHQRHRRKDWKSELEIQCTRNFDPLPIKVEDLDDSCDEWEAL